MSLLCESCGNPAGDPHEFDILEDTLCPTCQARKKRTKGKLRTFLVRLSGCVPDGLGNRKRVEAHDQFEANRIALRLFGRAISAACEGECPPGKWRATEFVPYTVKEKR